MLRSIFRDRIGEGVDNARASLGSFLDRKPCLDPSLFSFRVVRDVCISQRHQFTGSVCAGVSMYVGAVGNDLSFLVGQ